MAPRGRIQLSAQLRLFDRGMSANVLDLSKTGMAIRASEVLHADHVLEVSFTLPFTNEKIDCEAKVIWSDGRGHAGLQFRELDENTQQAIGQWLTQYLAVPH